MIRNSIRNKLIVFLLAATIVPIASSIVITYVFTKQNVSLETIRSNSNLIFQGKTNIINYMNTFWQNSLLVYNDTTLYTILEEGSSDFLSHAEISRAMQSMLIAGKDIHQLYLHVSGSGWSYLLSPGLPQQRTDKPDPKFIPDVHHGDVTVEPTHRSHEFGISRFPYVPPAPVVTMHRSIANALTGKELGTLSVDINVDVIRSISEQLYKPGDEELYIIARDGSVVYGPDPAAVGSRLEDDWVAYLMNNGGDSGSFDWNNSKFRGVHIYERMKTSYVDWMLVKRIPYESLYRNARQVTQLNAAVYVLFLIVVIMATLYISFRFTQPIRNLLGYISKIQAGHLDVDIRVTSHDEIGILARRFRMMMQTINNLITSEYKLDIANKTNQLKALQAQINPHFLYNALQSIGTLALQHNAPKVYSLISSLAKMMRYSMNTDETLVPLSAEIAHIKSYMQLQTQRFENELTAVYDVEQQTLSIPVPKMTLQPLVENYFKHGFDPRSHNGELLVASALEQDGTLIVRIRDNGRGMDAGALQTLQRRLKQPRLAAEHNDGGIGLLNVQSRLTLYYGNDARLDVYPVHPNGLEIRLTIPPGRGEE